MELFNTSYNSSVYIALICIYFLSESISTFDTRIIQAKKGGYLRESDIAVPGWTAIFIFIGWVSLIAMILLNPIAAFVVFIVKYILKVMPVLENIGALLLTPFTGKNAFKAVNSVSRQQKAAKSEVDKMMDGSSKS